ncbi:MAG: class I adenylate-forming enzyme family protein, partial [Candidatus Omnitrophota bacterium]
IFLPNTPEAIFTFLAGFSIGGVLVPLDFMLTENEVINFINHSQAKILVTQIKKEIDLEKINEQCPTLKKIIIQGTGYRAESIEQKAEGMEESFSFWSKAVEETSSQVPSVEIDGSDPSAIFYTSGSTGHPKGVEFTYKHFDNSPKVINHFLRVCEKDIFLCGGVPFSHVGGFGYILLLLEFGSGLVLMERFHPLEFLKNIQRHKVTIFCIVPAMYVAILSLKVYDKFDLSSLRVAVVFGAPSAPSLLKRFHQACPDAQVLNGWGMTETAAPNTFSPPDENKIDSIGKFTLDMEVKIVDEEGNNLGPEAEGELQVRGEAVMSGYYKEPQLTKEVLTEDGWLKTGDIAKFDSNGLYYLVGRKKDMIKVAGEIVFSCEVEEKIHRHPKIKEAAVVGVPDSLRGEVPKAFIVLEEEAVLFEQELRDFLKQHLAHFKIPHHFEFVKELPKTRTGKVDKVKLVHGQ